MDDTDCYPGPFGLISDAHGNPIGLKNCVDALREKGAQTLFFLGDAVGYFPLEGRVLDILMLSGAVCLKGNHEAMLLGELPIKDDTVYQLEPARKRLSQSHRDWMASWPSSRDVGDSRTPTRRLLLAHGTPDNFLGGHVYPDSDLAFLTRLDQHVFAAGQTHRVFIGRANGRMAINVGSVGMPRDIGFSASCVLLDLLEDRAEILRVSFDTELLLEQCLGVGEPHDKVVALLSRHENEKEKQA